ncbi:GNAT family N-acetyltransferase [Bacillus sp. REN3]|uniref:GNAT family N-acetyltransferase n=1 Tax=Bacillus sp. REN3 TaxID=2802440 RepID=UPI001AED16D0|nr:GNAT family N-acetyltransferase [Bacillus sp. REN3]
MSARIVKASVDDAEKLTAIMTRTFDEEARKWLPKGEQVVDYNIQPPGYDSLGMNKFMIRELEYFKILFEGEIVGGIIVTLTGKSYGRIDRLFINPDFQRKGIGTTVIERIQDVFPNVRAWDLETSSRQISNHAFYEKTGFQIMFQTAEEYHYIKRTRYFSGNDQAVRNKDLSSVQYENCNMENSEFYQVNLQGSSISNSNFSNSHLNNTDLSHSRFRNINFRHNLFADLNMANSELAFVTLSGVRFTETNLGSGKEPIAFDRCNLEGSVFSDCNLQNAEISNSNISGLKVNNIPIEELLSVYKQVTGTDKK